MLQEQGYSSPTLELLALWLGRVPTDEITYFDKDVVKTTTRKIAREKLIELYMPIHMTENHKRAYLLSHKRSELMQSSLQD